MSKILLSIVAASALAGAAIPAVASAQPYGGHDRGDYGRGYDDRSDYGRGGSINARQAELADRIDRGIRTGRLTGREAYALRSQSREIARLEYRYRAGGLSRWERRDLTDRLDRLATRLAYEMRDGDRYGSGYGPGRGW